MLLKWSVQHRVRAIQFRMLSVEISWLQSQRRFAQRRLRRTVAYLGVAEDAGERLAQVVHGVVKL